MKRISLLFSAFLFTTSALAAGYGAAMPAGEATDIGVALSAADAGERSGKFSGRIVQVCQKEGCWLVIESNGAAARVRTKDHAFLVPKDAQGTATVFGVLSPVQLEATEAKHLSDDAGGAAVAPREWQIVASAIVIEP
jgi:hypothetical protein